MSVPRDDFEKEEYEETEETEPEFSESEFCEPEFCEPEFIEEDYEDTYQEEDLFEEPEEKPSSKRKEKTKPKKPTVDVQDAKKPFSRYLLIGIGALCFLGGGLWIVMPVLMTGNKTPYSANQNFQTAPSLLTQPQVQQQKRNLNDLFVQSAPNPAVQEPLGNQMDSDIQNLDTITPVDKSMAKPVLPPQNNIENNRSNDIREIMVEHKKVLEKLKSILTVVQEIKSQPSNNELFENNELLKNKNKGLQQAVTELTAENKDLKGKNTYLRSLQNKQAKEIKSLNLKLSKAKSNEGPDRFVHFSNKWQLTGLTSHFAIFLNTKDLSVVRVNKGETIDGVKIVDINSYSGIIKTSVGDITYNAG